MSRVIGHLDLDYFFAQVEEIENPSLKGKPVLVCVYSGRTEESGVVSTANYKARELGVHSGMPIAQAKKKLEGVSPVLVRMDHEKYEVISGRIMEVLTAQVDILEPTGIDEAFFDLTASTGGDFARAHKLAESIKGTIFEQESLTSSIGLGRSKIVAKLGSEISKPNGLLVVRPEDTETFLRPLSPSKLYGVGPKTNAVLDQMGIRTVGDLAATQPTELERRFGRKFAAYLLAASTGTDGTQVVAGMEPTQFSRIITLKHDTRDAQEALRELAKGIGYIHEKLIASGKSFRTVTAIGILTDLSNKTRSKTFETPINDATTLQGTAQSLLQELSGSVGRDFRRVGVRVSGLTDTQGQSSLSEFIRARR